MRTCSRSYYFILLCFIVLCVFIIKIMCNDDNSNNDSERRTFDLSDIDKHFLSFFQEPKVKRIYVRRSPHTGNSHHTTYNEEEKVRTVVLTKKIPVPYKVEVEKKVPYYIKVPVSRPYAVYVPKPYTLTVEKPIQVPVKVYIPTPYKVEKKIPVPVKVEVERFVPIPVEKPYPVYKDRLVGEYAEKPEPYPVKDPHIDHFPSNFHSILPYQESSSSSEMFKHYIPIPMLYANPISLNGQMLYQFNKPVFYPVQEYSTSSPPQVSEQSEIEDDDTDFAGSQIDELKHPANNSTDNILNETTKENGSEEKKEN